MAEIKTEKIPANNEAGYVIVNAEDVGTDAVAKWAPAKTERMLGASDSETDDNSSDDADAGAEDLMKHTKAELVAMAEAKGVKIVPDEYTKQMIIDSILAVAALPDADPAK